MSLDDLLKGLAVFNQGIKEFAVSRGVNDANEQLAQINQAEQAKLMKTEEAAQARMNLGNELGLRLAGAGADASVINQLTSQLAPSAGAKFQAGENRALQSDSQEFKASESKKDRQHQLEMQRLKGEQMGVKDAKKERQLYAGFADKFRKENQGAVDAKEKLSALRSILDLTPDRVGIEMAKTGLLKFAGEDRVSDADVARAQRDPSARAGIARRLKLEATGEAIKDDRKFYQMILNHAEKKLKETLSQKVKGYSQGTAELADVDAAKLESGLVKQLGLEESQAKTVAKKFYNAKQNKTKVVYSDGSEEILDGRQ